jgi:hypothetical protein
MGNLHECGWARIPMSGPWTGRRNGTCSQRIAGWRGTDVSPGASPVPGRFHTPGRDAHATPRHAMHPELWYQTLSCWFEVARASRPWIWRGKGVPPKFGSTCV